MAKIVNDFAESTDLQKLLPDLWRGRKLILISMVAAAVTAVIGSLIIPNTYESEVGLLLMPPPFKDQKDELTSLIPKTLGVPDYEIMLHSDGILLQAVTQVRDEAKGEKKDIWTEDALEELSKLTDLRSRMYVTTEVSEKNVTATKYSPVIRLTARARTPEQAQHLAQAWAQVSTNLAMKLYTKGKTGLSEFMRKSFEDTKTMLFDVNKQIRDSEIEWNDELEHARLAKKHERYLQYEEKRTDAEVKLAALMKEIELLQSSFDALQPTLELWKSPPMDAVFLGKEMGKKTTPGTTTSEEGEKRYGYKEEVINSTYFGLEAKLVEKKSELESLKEFEQQMTAAMSQLEGELQDVRRECAVRDYERKALDIQLAPLKSAYDILSLKVQQAKIAESEQDNLADIKIMADAVAPDKKYWPPRTLIVLGATLLAGMAAAGFIVARGYLQRAGAFSEA